MDAFGNFDFQAREAAIRQRQARLAQLMRDQAQMQDLPGRMVSGHYVAPSWAQSLNNAIAPSVDQGLINRERQGIQQDVAAYNAADRRAAIEHAMGRPQPQPELVGPTDPRNPRELKGKPISQQALIEWAQKGADIPSRRDVVARILQDVEVNEPIRQEEREFRSAEAAANRQLRSEEADANRQLRREQLQQQADAARQRSEDTRLAIEQRREAAREHRDYMMELGRMRAETAAAANRTASRAKVSDSARREFDEFTATNQGLADAIKALDKASSKGTGWVAGVVSNAVPGGASLVNKYRDKSTNDAIQQITYYTDEIRHGRFGSALTATEKASAAQYLPSEHDDLAQIKEKAKGIQKLIGRNHQRLMVQMGGSDAQPEGGWTAVPAPSPKAGRPKVDDVEDGYRYKGGDPSDPTSWVKQ